MKYNPKVVSIKRSAAYVHHRALKNMRDNNHGGCAGADAQGSGAFAG